MEQSPPLKIIYQLVGLLRVHTPQEIQLSNIEVGDYIHIQSDGIEYRIEL